VTEILREGFNYDVCLQIERAQSLDEVLQSGASLSVLASEAQPFWPVV